jgi:predicted NBD/HSP70 family sugar kinase
LTCERVAIADLAHTILAEADEPLDVDHEADEGIGLAGRMVRELLHDVGVSYDRVTGVGMGLPGPLRRDTGEIGDSAILPGWIGARPQALMSEELGSEVRVENDANLGALAEIVWGAGRGCSELVYVKVLGGRRRARAPAEVLGAVALVLRESRRYVAEPPAGQPAM